MDPAPSRTIHSGTFPYAGGLMMVSGFGPKTATWAVVGEAPGAQEDKIGKPFVGPSGVLLRYTLEKVGLDPDEGYITNVIKERPPNNKTPTTKEINASRAALSEELSGLPNLRAVLVVGNVPLQALTGKTGITKNRGTAKVVLDTFGKVDVYGTLHPAAVLRRKATLFNGFVQDLAAFGQLVNPAEENINMVLVEDRLAWDLFVATADPEYRRITKLTRCALDIETTVSEAPTGTRKWWTDLYGVADGPEQVVCVGVTFDGRDCFIFPEGKYLDRAQHIIEDNEWVMHNGYFDTLAMKALKGWDIPLAHDTMAMAYLLHPEERKSLEILSSVYLGLPPYKTVDYENILEEDPLNVYNMNATDISRTWKLYRPMADELNENKDLSRIYQWILMPGIQALTTATHNGVPFDRERGQELAEEYQDKVDELLAYLKDEAPLPDKKKYPKGWPKPSWWRVKTDGAYEYPGLFNPASPKQVAHVIHDHFDYPVLEETPTGQASTKDDVLAQLLEGEGPHSPWVLKLRDHRSYNKMLGSFLLAWPKLLDTNGRLHPRFKPLFTMTGRLSSEYPNIQQVPIRGDHGVLRSLFGNVPGWSWIVADYSQIELRIAAWLAQERTMLEAFRDGEDLHMLTAERVLGEASIESRRVGKTLNFGLLYEAGPETLRRVARQDYGVYLSSEEAKEYRRLFFQSYPDLKRWHQTMRSTTMATQRSVSPLGRIRNFPECWYGNPEENLVHAGCREALNHPVQSMAHDMLLMSFSRVAEKYGEYMVAEVHDEMDLFVPNEMVDEVSAFVKETMEDIEWLGKFGIKLTVPVFAEVEKGNTWQEAK